LLPTPTLCFFHLDYLFFVMILFSALSRGLLIFLLSRWLFEKLRDVEMNVFSSNPFEDFGVSGFRSMIGMFKVRSKYRFLFLVRLGLVQGAWRMNMSFFSWIYTFCAVSGVVGNILGGMNYDGLHNL
jgi:hypothetical protein